jgi:hypothetical protein
MGFLANDTNNILLDAVLTDTGRQFLARNDGSFSVVKFALGDDEVDYSTIQKFGRTVGKEKIEKNTPVFEALTNQNHAQKHRLISISDPNLIRLPTIELVGTSAYVSLGSSSSTTAKVELRQTITNESSIIVDLVDAAFEVELNNLFLRISGDSPDSIDGTQRARYLLVANNSNNSLGGSSVSFTLQKQSITDAQFSVFGISSGNSTQISTFVKVSGVNSGAVKEFEVIITK